MGLRIAIKSPFEAYLYLDTRTVRLSASDGQVHLLVEDMLIPPDVRHNFKTLAAYNEALIQARECTGPISLK